MRNTLLQNLGFIVSQPNNFFPKQIGRQFIETFMVHRQNDQTLLKTANFTDIFIYFEKIVLRKKNSLPKGP